MGRGRGARRTGEDRLTVSEAAELWKVARSTVYNWIESGLLTCFGASRASGAEAAPRAEVLAARVLRVRELRAFDISDADVARAVQARIVPRPAGGRSTRFSLNDVAAIRAFASGQGGDRGRRRPSGVMLKTSLESEFERERAWAVRGADPSELDDDDFDTPAPPSLRARPGVFFYDVGDGVAGQPGARYVTRTAGWDYVDGNLEWFERDDRFAVLGQGERLRPEWVHSNHLYRIAQRIWIREWAQRARRRRSP